MLITITGRPCTGKSTLAKIFSDKYKFKVFSFGAMFKAEAQKRGLSDAEFSALRVSDPSFDFYIDKNIIPLAKEHEKENVVFDSRVAFHFLPQSFKVYLTLSEDEMANRLLNSGRTGKDHYTSKKKALSDLIDRMKTERQRYKNIYNFDLEDFSNYDLVVDTENKSPEEIADYIYKECVKFYKKTK